MAYKAETTDWESVLESNGFKRVTTLVTSSLKKSIWLRTEDYAAAHIVIDKDCPPKILHPDGTPYDDVEVQFLKDLHYFANPVRKKTEIIAPPRLW